MLSDEQKVKIRLEEIFRSEVRAELTSRDGASLWKLVNSPFGIFLASSVILGLGTFLFTRWEAWSQRRETRASQIERIDLEVTSRLRYYHTQTFFLHMESSDALVILENPNASRFPNGVFEDLRNRSLASLLLELHSIVPDAERAEIKGALDGALELGRIYATLSKEERSPLYLEHGLFDFSKINAITDIYTITSTVFNRPRWGNPFELGWDQQVSPKEQAQRDRQELIETYLGEEWTLIRKDRLSRFEALSEEEEPAQE